MASDFLYAADPGGTVELDARPLAERLARRDARQLQALRIVFQHPDASLNRALPVKRLVGRALAHARRSAASDGPNDGPKQRSPQSSDEDANEAVNAQVSEEAHSAARIAALLEAVRVPVRYLAARARQLSGGLKQRVAIAQAFAGEPRVVICDEPTSALDVSVQAAILNLLARLQRERGVSYLFISHDLDVVRYLADRVMVLYAGRVLESGPASAVLNGPCHPYTETLLNPELIARDTSASDIADGEPARDGPGGTPDSAARSAVGCIFSARCPRKLGAICDEAAPPFEPGADGHRIRCHIPAAQLRELQAATDPAHSDP